MSLAAIIILSCAELRAQRGRLIAGAIALSIAASLVLATLASVRAVLEMAPRSAQQTFAADELHLAVTDLLSAGLPAPLLADLRADPRVAVVDVVTSIGMVPLPATATGENDVERFYRIDGDGWGGWIDGRHLAVGAWSGDTWHAMLKDGRWPQADSGDVIELVLPARGLPFPARLDQWLRLESDSGVHRARVVGITRIAPDFMPTDYHKRMPQMLSTPAAVARLAGRTPATVAARIRLHDAAQRSAFRGEWEQRLASAPGRLALWDRDTIAVAALDGWHMRTAQWALRIALVLGGTTLVVLALAVQGMAMRERLAQFTLLRALGAGRGTLFLAVLVSAVPLTLAALFGAMAIVWGGTTLVSQLLGLMATPSLDAVSILTTAAIVFAGVVLGTAWPAWRAARVQALAGSVTSDPHRAARRGLVAGLLLLALMVVLASVPIDGVIAARLLLWMVWPGLVIGLLLITPWMVSQVCRLGARPVAWLTGSDALLLADQVSGDGARSTGAVAAVGIGLSAFVALMIWGAGMLALFVIDPAVPRWWVSIHPHGLDRAETERLLSEAPLRRMQPLIAVDTVLGHRDGDDTADDQQPTAVIGIDPQRALVGADALPLRFIAGTLTEAATALQAGDACLVNDWFARSQKLRLGDQVPLVIPGGGERTYRIAGIVSLRGWQMITKINKMRRHGEKHEVLVLLDGDTVRRDFSTAYANFLLADPPATTGVDAGFRSDLPDADAHAIARDQREALAATLTALIDPAKPVSHHPEGGEAVTATRRVIQVADLDGMRASLMGEWGAAAVKRMGIAPLFVLALALLPVIGTLVAALRARSRELGVLRSCGLTRSGLLRLALGEGLLLGVAALIIGSIAGALSAWMLLKLTTVLGYLFFIGLSPTFLVPWTWLWPGAAATIVICALAALWAGWRIGRIPPALLAASSTRVS